MDLSFVLLAHRPSLLGGAALTTAGATIGCGAGAGFGWTGAGA